MTPTDNFASDETQRDPAISDNNSSQDQSIQEGEKQPLTEEEIEQRRKFGTGRQRVRSTGTENKPIKSVSAEGVEHDTQRLAKKEPEDNLPDQLDRNK